MKKLLFALLILLSCTAHAQLTDPTDIPRKQIGMNWKFDEDTVVFNRIHVGDGKFGIDSLGRIIYYNNSAPTAGKMLYANGTYYTTLSIGTAGQLLRVNTGATAPEWFSPSYGSGTVTSVATTAPITGGPILTTGTIGITQSTTSTDGYLSSTDWNTFNNKVATTRTISTTSPLSGGGDLSANRTITIADAAADGSTKGAAAFSASGFTASGGVISQETQMSITVDGSGLKLSGDAASPGNRYYYGTDASGTKGWYAHSGYALQFAAGQFNPADATVYYTGINPQSSGSTAAVNRIYIPRAGTITAAYVVFDNSGTLGTTETSTVAIRVNNTTDNTISAAVTNDARPTVFSNTSLNIAVSAGDYIELKWTAPTWATNPTAVRIQAIVNIQ